MPASTPTPAAQYLRMSTEDQPNSIPTQREAIQRYAAAHGFEIVATYADPGKSGLELRNRPGLQHLLSDVVTGRCGFRAILVFDVSRWGRFQDTDESAHYEFLCRRAGIPVHYCAEQFENDGRLPNAIMKTLKRTMAAEYSRELSVKISAAHRRMAAEGYHVGGSAGYALRRMLICQNGRKQVLQSGECKNLKTDRTVLVPGPKHEVECVRTIFELAAHKKNSALAIAQELNRRNMRYSENQLWDYDRVYRVLRNEKYLGSTVWGMRQSLFHTRPQPVRHGDWVIKPGAFPPLITSEQFANARNQISRRSTNPGHSDKYHLDRLAKFLAREKVMPHNGRRKRRRLSTHTWTQRFGTLLRAYELIGYKPAPRVVNSIVARRKILRLKAGLFDQLQKLFPSRVKLVHRFGERRFRVLQLDGHFRIAVYICRFARCSVSGDARWLLKLRPKEDQLPALVCIPDKELKRLTEFYFVSDLGPADTKFKWIKPEHPWLAPENRLGSLADFCRFATLALEGHPQAPLPTEATSVVGDVQFREDYPIVIIDGNEIQLSRIDAAIFRLLIGNAGHVVPRNVLSSFTTARNREIYLNTHIRQLRMALGAQFRNRIVTVRNEGYIYERSSTTGSI